MKRILILVIPFSLVLLNPCLHAGVAFNKARATFYNSSSTTVGGYISANTTWSLDGSPYVVVSDVIVEAGVNLTIEPGVVARFTNGTNLVIDGALIAEGNTTHPITFTSNSTTPTLGDWGSIHFRDSSDDASCVIDYGVVRFATTGISIASSSPLIRYCNISDNSGYGIDDIEPAGGSPSIYGCFVTHNSIGIHIRGGGPTITDNKISENVAGGIICDWAWGAQIRIERNIISSNGVYGIFCSVSGIAGGIVQISNNTISNNTGSGISSNGSGIMVIGNVISNNEYGFNGNAAIQISYNSIAENNAYDFYNSGGNVLNATYNWWGTTNETLIEEHIYDYYDDYNFGRVLYDPFLVPPVAIFTFSPEIPYAFGIMTFDASASFNPHGSVINYTWDFGDSNVVTTVSPVITHMYIAPSNYEITLTVADEFGLTNSTSTTIEVFQDNIPPITTHDYDNAWHNANFSISLGAVDNESGIKEICYRINNGLIRNVSTDGHPFITTESSNNTLEYWSRDNADNEELPHKILTGIKLDKTTPTIGTPSQSPSGTVDQGQEVKVLVSITDAFSGVKNATLLYTIDNGSSWETPRTMSYNVTTNFYETTIPGQLAGTTVKYQIIVYDNAGNQRAQNNAGQYFVYSVIPEFPSFLILPLFMFVTLLAVMVYRRKGISV